MAGVAVFLVFCLIPTSSTASPGLLSKNYAQIAQHFGFPFPKLPNVTFANVGKQCKETVEKLSTSELVLYLDAIGKPQSGLRLGHVGWFGSYSQCTKFMVDAHYCLAFFAVSALDVSQDYPILWGICAPKQCSEEDVTNAVQDIFSGVNQEFDSTVFKLIPHTFDDAASKPVFCNKKSEYTTGVITTLVLCGVILYLCLVGTIVDIAVSFAKSNSSPLNANDEFMSIRGVSTATDQSIPDAERISLLRPSPEVNLKECTSHQQEPVLPNVVVRFFLCFSLIQNTNRIMDTKVPPSVISSINGMRVLSMWWVILGHTYDFSRRIPVTISNLPTFYDIIHRFTFQAVGNGTYSVDSFFFLSGLLVAYLWLPHMEKKNGKLPLFKYYFHRFWRLTPTYMFVLLFLDKLLRFLGEGPLWHPEKFAYQCRKYWWTNLLYINNFYPTSFDAQCMGWTWYLANDMQFYIIAPAILFTAYRFRLRGLLVIVGVLMSISFITTAILVAHYDIAQPTNLAEQ
ncbi:nose resistant to fluoxetine protein 6-like [Orbicella faveolata]|uniref:nose resistant to fluoxetine protein 6-like n=1 Tax=Orbicella faveolata TaxID=48498 RepID=UPI0009E3DA72|nr:nose resistant to fluoxetine protein 6-like [Orbicella faveolata]